MTYMKPEMEIEKFDIIEEITAGGASTASVGGDTVTIEGGAETQSIGSDLIIG